MSVLDALENFFRSPKFTEFKLGGETCAQVEDNKISTSVEVVDQMPPIESGERKEKSFLQAENLGVGGNNHETEIDCTPEGIPIWETTEENIIRWHVDKDAVEIIMLYRSGFDDTRYERLWKDEWFKCGAITKGRSEFINGRTTFFVKPVLTFAVGRCRFVTIAVDDDYRVCNNETTTKTIDFLLKHNFILDADDQPIKKYFADVLGNDCSRILKYYGARYFPATENHFAHVDFDNGENSFTPIDFYFNGTPVTADAENILKGLRRKMYVPSDFFKDSVALDADAIPFDV